MAINHIKRTQFLKLFSNISPSTCTTIYDYVMKLTCVNLMLHICFCVYYQNTLVAYMLLKICNATHNLHDKHFYNENRNNNGIIFFPRCENWQLILTFFGKMTLTFVKNLNFVWTSVSTNIVNNTWRKNYFAWY